MNFFRCWSVRNVLDLYHDRRLTAGGEARVKLHLQACEECREEAEACAPISVPELSKVKVPEGLAESILEKLESENAPAESPMTLGETLRLTPARALGVAYCALILTAHIVPGIPSQAHAEKAARVLEVQR